MTHQRTFHANQRSTVTPQALRLSKALNDLHVGHELESRLASSIAILVRKREMSENNIPWLESQKLFLRIVRNLGRLRMALWHAQLVGLLGFSFEPAHSQPVTCSWLAVSVTVVYTVNHFAIFVQFVYSPCQFCISKLKWLFILSCFQKTKRARIWDEYTKKRRTPTSVKPKKGKKLWGWLQKI